METSLVVQQDKFLARKNEIPKWFSNEIVDGLQALALLKLKWAPPEADAGTVAAAWCITCWEMLNDWNEEQHTPYIRRGFSQMRQELKEFPAPVEFKERVVSHFQLVY